MKKQDEIDFYMHLSSPSLNIADKHQDLLLKLYNYKMPLKRKLYILEKWTNTNIWEYGVSPLSGWFLKDSDIKFNNIKYKEQNENKNNK